MKLIFNRVHLHNFFSFEDVELDLSNMGYTIVSGVNTRSVDNSQSNGSGKSSIFNGICYALTGETSQGLKNNIENIYADVNDCWVELDFNVDDDHFIVKRIKTPYSNMQITLNDVDISGKGIKESSKVLSEYLPDLTSMLIGSIIILGQGLPYRFANNHPGGRKELLEKLTKSDYLIQSIRDKLDMRQLELRQLLRTHEDRLVSTQTQVSIYEGQLNNLNQELSNLGTNEDVEERLKNIHINISKCLGEIGSFSTEKTKCENKADELHKILNDKVLEGYENKFNEDTKDLKSELDTLKTASISLKSEINTLKNEIKKLDSVVDICPTCGQKIPGVHKINTESQKKLLESKKIELNKMSSDIFYEEETYNSIHNRYKNQYDDELKSLTDEINLYQSKFKEYSQLLLNVNKKYNDLMKEEIEVKNFETNFNKIRSDIDNLKIQLNDLYKTKDEINSYILDDNNHLQVIQSLITLTKKEFRGILLENVIKYMNDKIKQFSQVVFNNDLLSFELNANYIDIKYDGKYYESLSGGEKQKIDIIIQLALRELLSTQLNIHSNILVVDEIFDNLDSVGCQGVMNLISAMNDIDSVFIISHHTSDLQISYDTEIIVTKEESGISTISVH